MEDEWGSFSITELESIKRPFGLSIERDIHFDEVRYYDQFPEKKADYQKRLKALKEKETSHKQNQDKDIER